MMNDKKAIQTMADAIKNQQQVPNAEDRLNRAMGKAINEVIFKGQEIAPIRNTVKAAIAKKVKEEIVEKFNHWVKNDKKDPNKFPFPK